MAGKRKKVKSTGILNSLIKGTGTYGGSAAAAATMPKKGKQRLATGTAGDTQIEADKGAGTRIMDMITGAGASQDRARAKAARISARARKRKAARGK
jgi:hypothetical protein